MSDELHGSHNCPPPIGLPTRWSTSDRSSSTLCPFTGFAATYFLRSAIHVDDDATAHLTVHQSTRGVDHVGKSDLFGDRIEHCRIQVVREALPSGQPRLFGRHHAVDAQQGNTAQD